MSGLYIPYKFKLTAFFLAVVCVFNFSMQAQISTFPYFQNFETNTGGWASGGTLSDWVWGTPSKPTITGAGGGTKCWVNGGLTLSGVGYNYNEVSYVTSPVFNFSSLSYPWISFKLFWETERKWDGGNLQYSLNGGTTWIRVGAVGDPIDCMNANWYNTSSISQLVILDPSKQGWGGNHFAFGTVPSGTATCYLGSGSNGWLVAKHCLTGLAGQPSVMFRFTFGAGFVCNYYDGLAFDDVLIQEGMANAPNFSYVCSGTPSLINFTSILPSCPNPTTTTLAWNFGDPASGASNNSTATNPSHTFSSSGIYTISLTQTGGPCNPPGIITHTLSIINSAITASTNVTCFGGNNGNAIVTATNGTGAYTYSWSPIGGNASTGINLTAGNYSVTVTDGLGCKKTSTVNITQPPVINDTINTSNTTCGNAVGAATITAGGGTPNYTYNWLPSGGTASVASNLAAGTYSAIITDYNGCTHTISATINSGGGPTVVLTGTNVTCFGGSTGIASATVIGGIAPYTYSWSPTGGTAIIATNLIAANYNLVVTDASGCVGSSAITITQPTAALTAVLSATNVTCNGFNNGIANVVASGGTTGYTYNWLPTGGTGTTANALTATIYSVTITDTKNCTATNTVVITQPNVLTAIVTSSNISCNGLNNGVAQVIASGGTVVYSYNWLPSGGTNSITTPNLTAGNYSVVVTDASGCTKTNTTTVTQPIPITNTITTNNVMCFGQTSGSVSVTASGGVGGYSYNWQPIVSNNANVTNIGAGAYTVVVTDANGCTKQSVITITQPQQLNIGNLNNQGICLGQTATLVANVSGGSPAYTVNWQPINSNGTSIFVSPTVTTNYLVTATDNNGCVSLPALITVSVAPSVSLSVNNSVSVCYEALTTLTTVASGGNGNYQYSWLPSNNTLSSLTFTAASNQQFTVSVSDGCSTVKKTITILVTTKPTIKLFPPTIGCAPLCVSYYDSTLINSGVIANWNWSFTNGQVSNLASPIICFTSAGSYSGSLNVVTTNNCEYQLSTIANISLSPKPKADFTSNLGYETTEYNASFLFTNASTNYTSVVWYAPNSPQYGNVIHANFNSVGLYPVTLIASNNFGCQDSVTKLIKINPEFTFFAPNCFTPNDNGLNDKFLPKGMGWKESTFKLAIYDRWGEQIYSTNDVLAGWDGTKGGEKVQDDVYVWKVHLKDIFNKEHNYVGHVSIVK